MQLGVLIATVDDIANIAQLGFEAAELNVRSLGDPAAAPLDAVRLEQARVACAQHGVTITALAYYDLAFKPPAEAAILPAYERVFDAATALDVGVVASMSGFDAGRDWNGNVALFAERFGPIADLAEQRGLRVACENWMGFWGALPFRPLNMGGSPDTWDAWFAAVRSPALGIEFDPSHLYWQGIDHLRALREYRERVFHVHAKDTEMLPERRYRGGVNGDYYRFRIPGYGQIDWTAFVAALDEIGYRGGVAIEHEDPIYSGARFDEGLQRGWQVLHPLIHPYSSRRTTR